MDRPRGLKLLRLSDPFDQEALDQAFSNRKQSIHPDFLPDLERAYDLLLMELEKASVPEAPPDQEIPPPQPLPDPPPPIAQVSPAPAQPDTAISPPIIENTAPLVVQDQKPAQIPEAPFSPPDISQVPPIPEPSITPPPPTPQITEELPQPKPLLVSPYPLPISDPKPSLEPEKKLFPLSKSEPYIPPQKPKDRTTLARALMVLALIPVFGVILLSLTSTFLFKTPDQPEPKAHDPEFELGLELNDTTVTRRQHPTQDFNNYTIFFSWTITTPLPDNFVQNLFSKGIKEHWLPMNCEIMSKTRARGEIAPLDTIETVNVFKTKENLEKARTTIPEEDC